jgi:hypothetical protein
LFFHISNAIELLVNVNPVAQDGQRLKEVLEMDAIFLVHAPVSSC